MFLLAEGTGGFVITNTNDLLGGMQKIGKEQNQYYIVGYTPPESAEGSCHTLKVKVDKGGTTVRSRAGYCNVKSHDVLAGNPIEKTLESRATATAAGTIAASMRAPFFYTGTNTARVAVAIEIPSGRHQIREGEGQDARGRQCARHRLQAGRHRRRRDSAMWSSWISTARRKCRPSRKSRCTTRTSSMWQ